MTGHCPFVIVMILTSFILTLLNLAFDSVSHTKLVYKLQAYGITGKLLKLLSDFFV